MPCLLLHWLTQCEHEWSPSVPGAVHLLAALQSQHVVTRHLNIVIGIYCCTFFKCLWNTVLYIFYDTLPSAPSAGRWLHLLPLWFQSGLPYLVDDNKYLICKNQKCLTSEIAARHCGSFIPACAGGVICIVGGIWLATGCWFFTNVVQQCVQSSQTILYIT